MTTREEIGYIVVSRNKSGCKGLDLYCASGSVQYGWHTNPGCAFVFRLRANALHWAKSWKSPDKGHDDPTVVLLVKETRYVVED
jgi:hypothetical protein